MCRFCGMAEFTQDVRNGVLMTWCAECTTEVKDDRNKMRSLSGEKKCDRKGDKARLRA